MKLFDKSSNSFDDEDFFLICVYHPDEENLVVRALWGPAPIAGSGPAGEVQMEQQCCGKVQYTKCAEKL
eukprot:1157935-Pelagomonas_calceolata.AAC.13